MTKKYLSQSLVKKKIEEKKKQRIYNLKIATKIWDLVFESRLLSYDIFVILGN